MALEPTLHAPCPEIEEAVWRAVVGHLRKRQVATAQPLG